MARVRLLTQERIARAAFDLVDRAGAGTLTMGNLARELGVAQMTLYNYAASKQAIIDMLPDVLFAGLAPVSHDGRWQTTVTRFFTDVYDRLISHREVAQLIAVGPVSSAAQDLHADALRVALESSGYSAKDALTIHRTLSTYTLGFALYQPIRHLQVSPSEVTEAEQFRLGLDAVIRAF